MSKVISRFERAWSAAYTAFASTTPSPIADFSVMP
jgi:hypothetical protein